MVAKRISLFPEHQSGTDDFDIKENATVRYDTVEVESRLKACFPLQPYRNVS